MSEVHTQRGFNVLLGYGLACIYGFTPHAPQGAYYPRNVLLLPSPHYCRRVLKIAREQGKLPPGL